jgi:O-antigen ligase
MLLKLNKFKIFEAELLSVSEILLLVYISSVIVFANLPLGSTVSKLLGIILVGYYVLFQVIWNKNKIYINRETKLILIWVFFCLISGFAASDYILFFGKILTVLQLTGFFIIGYLIILKNKIKIEHIFITVLVSVTFILILGVFQQESSSLVISSNRLSSTAGNPNKLAIYASYAFMFSMYLFSISKNKFVRSILFANQVLLIIGILKTESRKGFIIIPLGIFIYFLLTNYKKIAKSKNKIKSVMKYAFYFAILITLLCISFQLLKNTDNFRRFGIMTNYFNMTEKSDRIKIFDQSVYERQQFIKYGFQMWKDHPIIGVGLDNFRLNIKKYWTMSNRSYAHNNYIELLADTGLLGFLAYYSIYLSLIIKLFFIKKRVQLKSKYLNLINIFITIIFILMLSEIAMVTYSSKFIWLLIMLISGFCDRFLVGSTSYAKISRI